MTTLGGSRLSIGTLFQCFSILVLTVKPPVDRYAVNSIVIYKSGMVSDLYTFPSAFGMLRKLFGRVSVFLWFNIG